MSLSVGFDKDGKVRLPPFLKVISIGHNFDTGVGSGDWYMCGTLSEIHNWMNRHALLHVKLFGKLGKQENNNGITWELKAR